MSKPEDLALFAHVEYQLACLLLVYEDFSLYGGNFLGLFGDLCVNVNQC
jgi:hypothetical protein